VRRNRNQEAAHAALALVEAALEDPSPKRVEVAHQAVQALPLSLKDAGLMRDGLLSKLRWRCEVLRALLDSYRR
jgi:hypothetical protein